MNPATRPTREMVMDSIRSATYTRLPSGVAVVCELTLKNLHVVHGIAKVCDLENHDDQRGKEVAFNKALDEAFEFVAYDLHSKMLAGDVESNHAVLMAAYDGQPKLI